MPLQELDWWDLSVFLGEAPALGGSVVVQELFCQPGTRGPQNLQSEANVWCCQCVHDYQCVESVGVRRGGNVTSLPRGPRAKRRLSGERTTAPLAYQTMFESSGSTRGYGPGGQSQLYQRVLLHQRI